MKIYTKVCIATVGILLLMTNIACAMVGSQPNFFSQAVVPVFIERSPSRCSYEQTPELQFDAYQSQVIEALRMKQAQWQGADFRLDLDDSLIKFWGRIHSLPFEQNEMWYKRWVEFTRKLRGYKVDQLCVKYENANDIFYIVALIQALRMTLRSVEIAVK
jgi:hypothetical protein